MAGQVLEPSFTMREVLGSDDLEQTYTAVVDRCQGTTGRRQMAWLPHENYGWCSTAAGFVVSTATGLGEVPDTAHYCDASDSEAPDGRGSATSMCCVEHDKCLTCDVGDRPGCTGSSKNGGQCDTELAQCAWGVSCRSPLFHYWTCSPWSWFSGRSCQRHTVWKYDFDCLAVSTLISTSMAGIKPNNGHNC